MSAKTRTARIGVDVGGTFTDLVLHDPARDLVHTGKLLTTPDDPSVAIIAGISRLLQETDLKPSDLHSLVHGTTLVTNTIIERTGATVGLLTTEGFRDTIEIGRETRYDLYDLFLEVPPTLVPRHRRLEIPERIDTDGKVLLPLDEDAVAAAARQLVESDKCEALAIAFMHSYRSPEHERRAGEIVRRLYPSLPLSLSAEVAPEIREYERTSTACANAYVQPLMQRYLDKLEVDLGKLGFVGQLYIMLSGGGITSVREAKEYPDPLDRVRGRRPAQWRPPSWRGWPISIVSSPSTWAAPRPRCAWSRTAPRITSTTSRPAGSGAFKRAPACR